jgi:hypothetical protein
MRPGVSSPRVIKGCLESNPINIKKILAYAALANARATATSHEIEKSSNEFSRKNADSVAKNKRI